ncbi:MAG: diguanylate cyclase [Planctomycetaceae bacterium]|nr:diguanylate cyclase [Planctomycetaceae bacterium]
MTFKEHFNQQANVVIVDDDPAILNLLTHLLEIMGHHRVRSASDGNQALQMILQDCPDILITDCVMPGLDGLELCRRVRQLHARKVLPHYCYILLLTTQAGKNSFVEGLEAGADDFVEKNVSSLSDLRVEIQARFNAALRIRKLETGLEFAAKYDALTQLFNRIAFFEAAHTLWDRSIKNKTPLAAVMMDCDFFKRINDIHGHHAGDSVLRELASILKSFSRQSDVICRYGGEEFCAILPGCNEKTAWDWADRIRQQFEINPIKHSNFEIPITVSFGVAERTETTEFIDHLVDRADQALLAAKEWGRNRSVGYSEILAGSAGEAAKISEQLFGNVTAKDVMIPFPIAILPHDSAAVVADYFLKTRFDTLPVVDDAGHLIGTVSETDLIVLVGQTDQWTDSIEHLVVPTVISYPIDTPLRRIVDFLNRTSVRQVMIVQDKVLVGYISRTPLLRWLRNQWAAMSSQYGKIIPDNSAREVLVYNLKDAVNLLMKELTALSGLIESSEQANQTEGKENEFIIPDRIRLVSQVSQCQDLLDQTLKYGSIPTTEDSTILSS